MLYTEDFKKQVVKKILSPGVTIRNVSRKLKVSEKAIYDWKKQFADEMQAEIVQINVDALLYEEKVDIDRLLAEAETPVNEHEQKILDGIRRNQLPAHYTTLEKYAIISHMRRLSEKDAGVFLRNYGIQSGHIRQWEEEVLTMGKKQLDQNEVIMKLEEENKLLRKQLKASERDKRDLEIIIELKKKYPTLFKADGED